MLKGGLGHLGGFGDRFETLAYLDGPCARVLSVAGFLAFLALFLLGREEYLRAKKASLMRKEASLLQRDGQHCIEHWSHACRTGQYMGGMYTGRLGGSYLGVQGGIYTGWYIPSMVQGGIYHTGRQGRPLLAQQ